MAAKFRATGKWSKAHTHATRQFVLRPPTPDDADGFVATIDDEVRFRQGWDAGAWSDPVLVRQLFAGLDHGATGADALRKCAMHLLVCEPDGETVLGSYEIEKGERAHELGWWLGPTARGRGLGQATLPLVLDYVHRHLVITHVLMTTAVDNDRARRQIERTSAERVGEHQFARPNGQLFQSVEYVHVGSAMGASHWRPPCNWPQT